ncbi:MAG: glycosyltransferase family 39 protein [Anaerolineae bacterium]
MTNRQNRIFIVASTTTILLMLAITFDLSPWLRGDLDWRWDYFPWTFPAHFLGGLGTVLLYVAFAGWLFTNQKNLKPIVVGVAFFGALLLPVTVQWLNLTDPIEEILIRTTDGFLGGYQTVALEAESGLQFLADFTQNAPGWNPHPQRHPPGIVLSFIWAKSLKGQMPNMVEWVASTFHQNRCDQWPLLFQSDVAFSTVLWGFAPNLLSALTAFPLFALAIRLFERKRAELIVLAYPLIPAVMVFGGKWDLPLTLVAVLAALLLTIGWLEGKTWALFLAGLVLAIGLFLSHAILVLLGFAAIYSILLLLQSEKLTLKNLPTLFGKGCLFLAALFGFWLIYWWFIGDSYLDIYRVNTLPHFEMGSNYWLRLFYNPYDFSLYAGFLVTALALAAGWRTLAGLLLNQQAGQNRFTFQLAHAFGLGVLITIILLVISGSSRAEVGRVWLFLMPYMLIAAVSFFDRLSPVELRRYGLVLLLVMMFQSVVVQKSLTQRHPFPHQLNSPNIMIPLEETLGSEIVLAGWELHQSEFESGESIDLVLFWHSVGRADMSFTRFVHLFSEENGLVAQADGPPLDGRYPTSCWIDGEYIREDISIRVNDDTAIGDYQLLVGMYDAENDFKRLPTSGSGQATSTIILADQIRVIE